MVDHPAPKIRVLLLDHQLMFREGLSLLFEYSPSIELVGSTGARDEALVLAAETNPDVILIELEETCDDDFEVITDLVNAARKAKIILLSAVAVNGSRELAVKKGVVGIVNKTDSFQVLIRAIEKVNLGEVWIDRATMASVLNNLSRAHLYPEPPKPEAVLIEKLSGREQEIITLVCQGLKNKEIARKLSISESTARHYLSSIYEKLNVFDRADLMIFAYRTGLAECPK